MNVQSGDGGESCDKNSRHPKKSSRTPKSLKKFPLTHMDAEDARSLLISDQSTPPTQSAAPFNDPVELSSDLSSRCISSIPTPGLSVTKSPFEIPQSEKEFVTSSPLNYSTIRDVEQLGSSPHIMSGEKYFRDEQRQMREHKFYKYPDSFFRPILEDKTTSSDVFSPSSFNYPPNSSSASAAHLQKLRPLHHQSEKQGGGHHHHHHHHHHAHRHSKKQLPKQQSQYDDNHPAEISPEHVMMITPPSSNERSLSKTTPEIPVSPVPFKPSELNIILKDYSRSSGLDKRPGEVDLELIPQLPFLAPLEIIPEGIAEIAKDLLKIPAHFTESPRMLIVPVPEEIIAPRPDSPQVFGPPTTAKDYESRHNLIPARSRRLIRTKKLAKNLMKQGITGIQDTIRTSSFTGAFAGATRPRSGTILSQLTVLAKKKKTPKTHTPKPVFVQMNQYESLPFMLWDEDYEHNLRRHSDELSTYKHSKSIHPTNEDNFKKTTTKQRRRHKLHHSKVGSAGTGNLMVAEDFTKILLNQSTDESVSSSEEDRNHVMPGVWLERGRWIKYEENVEWDLSESFCRSRRWGKPHVPFLSFYSLLELRKYLSTGIVIFDLEVDTYESMIEYIMKFMSQKDMIIERELRYLKNILLSPHKFALQSNTLTQNLTTWLTSLNASNFSQSLKKNSMTVPSGMDESNLKKDSDMKTFKIPTTKNVKFKRASTSTNLPALLRKKSSTFLSKFQGSIGGVGDRTSIIDQNDLVESRITKKTALPRIPENALAIHQDGMSSDLPPSQLLYSPTAALPQQRRGKRQSDPLPTSSFGGSPTHLTFRNSSSRYRSILKKRTADSSTPSSTKIHPLPPPLHASLRPDDPIDPQDIKRDKEISSPSKALPNTDSSLPLSTALITGASSSASTTVPLLRRMPVDSEGAAVLVASLPADSSTKFTSRALTRPDKPLSIFVRLNKPLTVLPFNERQRLRQQQLQTEQEECSDVHEILPCNNGKAHSLPTTSILEVPTVPLRFFYFLIGAPAPPDELNTPGEVESKSRRQKMEMDATNAAIELSELGRCFCTLMANKFFQEVAYQASHCREIVLAFNEFLNESIVMPSSEVNAESLLPLATLYRDRILAEKSGGQESANDNFKKHTEPHQLLQPTAESEERGTIICPIFKGLISDVRRKSPWYVSDFKDAWSWRCFVTVLFIYLTTMPSSITFGGLLSEKTDNWIGVSEIMVADALGGLIFALFSGQPLVIVTVTGPLLVFEESLYTFTQEYRIDYVSFRVWIGIWVALITILAVAVDICSLIKYFTRFIEEIFALTIALVFIYEVGKKVHKLFIKYPLLIDYCRLRVSVSTSIASYKIDNKSLVAFQKNLMLTQSYVPLREHYSHMNTLWWHLHQSTNTTTGKCIIPHSNSNSSGKRSFRRSRRQDLQLSSFLDSKNSDPPLSITITPTTPPTPVSTSSSLAGPKLFYFGAGQSEESQKPELENHKNNNVTAALLPKIKQVGAVKAPPEFPDIMKQKLKNVVNKFIKIDQVDKSIESTLKSNSSSPISADYSNNSKSPVPCVASEVNSSHVNENFPFHLYRDNLKQFQNYYYESSDTQANANNNQTRKLSKPKSYDKHSQSAAATNFTFFYTSVLPYYDINFTRLYSGVLDAPDGNLILDRDFKRCKIARPNTAIFSTIIILSTFLLAYFLRSIGTGVGLTNQSAQTKLKRESIAKKAFKYPNLSAQLPSSPPPYSWYRNAQSYSRFKGVFQRIKTTSTLSGGTAGSGETIANYREFISSLIPLSMRRVLGDFGPPIALIIMSCIDTLWVGNNVYTEKLNLHSSTMIGGTPLSAYLSPTLPDRRGWLINPFGTPNSAALSNKEIALAVLPAAMLFTLLFVEGQLTALLINKKERKLRKGGGYNLDLLVIGLTQTVMGALGLPWISPAPIQSLAHVSCLSYYNTLECAPGEKPKVLWVREQRVTAFCVSLITGLTLMFGSALLQRIPVATLFGIFLYLGFSALNGIQFFDRLKLFIVTPKLSQRISDAIYIRKVPFYKIHLFTLIQLTCLILLWTLKFTPLALFFPLILLLIVPLRYKLGYLFSKQELYYLDMEEEEKSSDNEQDFYTEAHIPV